MALYKNSSNGIAIAPHADAAQAAADVLAEATKQAFRYRMEKIRDPEMMDQSPQSLIDADFLDSLAARIDPRQAAAWNLATGPGDTT